MGRCPAFAGPSTTAPVYGPVHKPVATRHCLSVSKVTGTADSAISVSWRASLANRHRDLSSAATRGGCTRVGRLGLEQPSRTVSWGSADVGGSWADGEAETVTTGNGAAVASGAYTGAGGQGLKRFAGLLQRQPGPE